MQWTSPEPEATRRAARALAECLDEAGLVVTLVGPLGAGKTLFTQGLAEGLGVDPRLVASPTFTIASEYPLAAGPPFAHLDCYRLESEAELEAVGFLDLLTAGRVVAIEWADRFPDAMPPERLEVTLERETGPGAESRRVLHARAFGRGPEAVLARWQARLSDGSEPQAHP